MITVFFDYTGQIYRAALKSMNKNVYDNNTKSDITISGQLAVLNRLVVIPVREYITINGFRYKIYSQVQDDDGIFSRYELTREEKSERVI